MSARNVFTQVIATAICVGAVASTAAAQATAQNQDSEKDPMAGLQKLIELRKQLESENTARKLTERGAKFLIASQEDDGGWVSQTGPGVTALVLKALIQAPSVSPSHPSVERGLAFVDRFYREDGGAYASGSLHKNYESSVVLSMLSVLDNPAHKERRDKLVAFLKAGQWDESEDISEDHPFYGGAGYGRHKRPDLSNTNLMVEALHDSGLSKDDPAYKKALVFIERCQMLGEVNDMDYADGSTQGGFIYATAHGGESKAGTFTVDGREELRAYGSMTYAGLKSMVYAGLSKDDPRVRAAVDWIKDHWTLEKNPNMPEDQAAEGLFYYFHTFARALDAYGERTLTTSDGKARNWRVELVEALQGRQRRNGSWVNEEDRWMEGVPPLTTAYSMLALQAAFPQEVEESGPRLRRNRQ
jgi:squalene-hopene/tetraprenyl-beta-curcumene cyclase